MPRRRALPVATALTLTAALAAPASGALGGQRSSTTRLVATLTGAAEVPGPGDADGRGRATITLDSGRRTVCFRITGRRIDQAAAGHIHEARAGRAGPVVVPLFTRPVSVPPEVRDCVRGVSRRQIRDIARRPRNYYVNLHNGDYPAGAIRGQLRLAR